MKNNIYKIRPDMLQTGKIPCTWNQNKFEEAKLDFNEYLKTYDIEVEFVPDKKQLGKYLAVFQNKNDYRLFMMIQQQNQLGRKIDHFWVAYTHG